MTWPKDDAAPWSLFNYCYGVCYRCLFVCLFSEWSLGSCWMGSWPESAGDKGSISSSCPLHSSEFFLYICTVQATICSNINITCTALQTKTNHITGFAFLLHVLKTVYTDAYFYIAPWETVDCNPSSSVLWDVTELSQDCEAIFKVPGIPAEVWIPLHTQNQISPSVLKHELLIVMGILNSNILLFRYHTAAVDTGIQPPNFLQEAVFS